MRLLGRNIVRKEAGATAIEHAITALDFYYLAKGLNILTLIQNIHPDYNRDQMFRRTGQPTSSERPSASTRNPTSSPS